MFDKDWGRSENHEIDTLWILFPVLTQLEFSNWILTFEVWCRTFVQNLETELREDISHFHLQSLTLPISKIWHTGAYKSGAINIKYMYVEILLSLCQFISKFIWKLTINPSTHWLCVSFALIFVSALLYAIYDVYCLFIFISNVH